MKPLLDSTLLARLKPYRLAVRTARASSGIGERTSRRKGLGMEFEDHREYQPGDDIRHLDVHVWSRLGVHAVRQFARQQQLAVTVLVDCSASMAAGSPAKLELAVKLAAMIAQLSVSGSDRVRVGAISAGKLRWYAPCDNQRQLAQLFRWLAGLRPTGNTDLRAAALRSRPLLTGEGMLVVISDWLCAERQQALKIWQASGQEIIGLQVLAAEELDPALNGSGPVNLTDSESGTALQVDLGPATFSEYRQVLDSFLESLRAGLVAGAGRRFLYPSGADLEREVLAGWRESGFVR